MESNYVLLVLKTDRENARLLDIELERTEYSFLQSFSTELLVERKDADFVKAWFADRGVDCIVFQKSRVIDDTMETFNVHPDWFDMSHDQAMIYEYIANKYDFKTMDIDIRKLRNAVEGLIYKEEKEFCKENGIYDNYDWDRYCLPFLKHGHEYLRPTLMVKILNEKGYRQIKGDDIDYNKDISPFWGVYVRKEIMEQVKKIDLDSKVRDWYLDTFPGDAAVEDMLEDVSFNDVIGALNEGKFYPSTLGVRDHTVFRCVFNKIAELLYVPKDVVANKWILMNDAPALAVDTVAQSFTITPETMPDYKLMSVEESYDGDYGASVVQFSRFDGSVSFAFSDVSADEAIMRPELVMAELMRNNSHENAPIWSELSSEMVGLITDSAFDMKFIESDDDYWSEEMADKIWDESVDKGLDSVVTYGENDALITVYAGAMTAVNWKGHPDLGKPCLENRFQSLAESKSLVDQMKEAEKLTHHNDNSYGARNNEPVL